MKGRPSLKGEKSWAVLPQPTESEEVIDQSIKEIQGEWKIAQKDHRLITTLREKTYSRRREMVLLKMTPLVDIIKTFPALQNMLYVSWCDFS